MSKSSQPDLFDTGCDSGGADAAQARTQMREVIDRLRATSVPPWKQYVDVIMQDGSFKRTMWRVPQEEGDALWAEFDVEMERLYLIWAETQPDSTFADEPEAASPLPAF